jgi:RNA 3'-terminal phosphate cyclase
MEITSYREHNVYTSHAAATCADAKTASSPSEEGDRERERGGRERERERERGGGREIEMRGKRERERERARARGSEREMAAHLGHDVVEKLKDDAASRLAVDCAVEEHLWISGRCRGGKGPRPP